MDTLKTQTVKSNHVVFNPPGVASTPMYRVLIDNMCL